MNYWKTLKKYWYIPVALVIVTTVLSLVISFVQTPKYSSTVKLLVIQRQGSRLDAYSAARSAETIASVLSRMIYTTSFFDQVSNSQFKLENTFSSDQNKRKKEWEQMVAVNSSTDGALEIDVFHPNRELAEGYALAIAYVLVNSGQEYHGGDNQVEIKMVDEPNTSQLPASPNVMQNSALGIVSGLILSISVILFIAFREDSELFKTTIAPEKLDLEPEAYTPQADSGEHVANAHDGPVQPSVAQDWFKTGKFETSN